MGIPLHHIVTSATQFQQLQQVTQSGTRNSQYLVHLIDGAKTASLTTLAAQVVLQPQATRKDECQVCAFAHVCTDGQLNT
jgi:hypothetical protein